MLVNPDQPAPIKVFGARLRIGAFKLNQRLLHAINGKPSLVSDGPWVHVHVARLVGVG